MNIDLHIERLILDGLPAAITQGDAIGAAVEAELARLFTSEGLAATDSRAAPRLPAAYIHLISKSNSASLGEQIGGAVYDVLNQATQQTVGRSRAAAAVRPKATVL